MTWLNLHLPKKIIIFVTLIFSFIITILISDFFLPPYPRFDRLIAFSQKIAQFKPSFNLSFKTFHIWELNKNPNQPNPTNITSDKINSIIFDHLKNTPTNASSFPNPSLIVNPNNPQPTTPLIPSTINSSPPSSIFYSPTPKPTKKPKPSPTPKFVLTNPRPGNNIKEIAQIVGQIMCVPPAMIYAIYDNEAGYLGPQVESNWTYYNTYHGSDPTDIPGSTQVFGVTQMMGDTWHKIKPYVGQKLGSTELSLEVTFDSMAAGAYHVGNISLAWKDKVGCDDWPVNYILYGACRYNGACPANTFGQKQYYNSYTYSVCNSYNEYLQMTGSSKQKNCNQ